MSNLREALPLDVTPGELRQQALTNLPRAVKIRANQTRGFWRKHWVQGILGGIVTIGYVLLAISFGPTSFYAPAILVGVAEGVFALLLISVAVKRKIKGLMFSRQAEARRRQRAIARRG